MSRELNRIFGIFDDVDLLAAQFPDDGLNAHAFHADTGSHAVHVAITALNRDLGAFARFARATFDGHGGIVNFGNFLFKKALDQFGIGARNHHARTLAGLIDDLDDATNPVADAEAFEARLLFLREARFRLAEIEHKILALAAFHDAIDQFAGAARVFVKHCFALGFADFLQNDLLGGLSRDAAQGVGWFRDANFGTDFRCGIDTPGFRKCHFMRRIFHFLDGFLDGEEPHRTRFRVEIGNVVFCRAEVFTRGNEQSIFHRVHHDAGIDALFFT